jgi:hypothetical protein
MDVSESYVRLCGEVSHFTKEKTGTSLVDAYFGPTLLSPEHQPKDRTPDDLIHSANNLIDRIRDEINQQLRIDHLIGECKSIVTVIEWLDGKEIRYADLVQEIFHIPMNHFSETLTRLYMDILVQI